MKKTTKTVAELQARKKQLEQDRIVASAKTDDASKARVKDIEELLEACDAQIDAAEIQAKAATARAAEADTALAALVACGEVPAQDEARKASLKAAFCDEANGAFVMQQMLAKAKGGGLQSSSPAAALTGRVAPNAAVATLELNGSASPVRKGDKSGPVTAVDGAIQKFGALEARGASYAYSQPSSGWDCRRALAGYAELVCANTRVGWNKQLDATSQSRKHNLSMEAANWYNTHLRDNTRNWESIEGWAMQKLINPALEATDYSDPNNELGILSGTLVLQRTLPVFAYMYPELLSMYTDFSDNPGLYQQTEATRIVIQPAVAQYSATLVTAGNGLIGGVPGGWTTAVEGSDTNVTITLSDYIAVPISIGNNIIAATTRRLFDEQAVLAIKGLAGYFTGMLTNLITSANYNYYATANGTTVPTAYPTYPVTSGGFNMKNLDAIDAIFTSAKVPENDRGILLNPTFYAALRSDQRLEFLYAASAKSIEMPGNFVSEARLPKLSGFAPYKAGYLPTSTPSQATANLPAPVAATTFNVAGFAYQKSAVLLKSRLPQDFSTALPGVMIPGSITTITDPDTKISIMLVQYIDLQQNYAAWRPEVMLGAAVADNRAGLVLTGQ